MVEMQVAGIGLDAASRSPIVLLRDPSGRRQVPIWIDQAQAQNILAGLDGRRPVRPLSHDLMVDLLKAGELRLERVIIHAIEDNTLRLSMVGVMSTTFYGFAWSVKNEPYIQLCRQLFWLRQLLNLRRRHNVQRVCERRFSSRLVVQKV